MSTVHTWADGFGIWHVRVPRTVASPLIAARRAIRNELTQRENNVDRGAWMHLERIRDLDDTETVVWREMGA